MENKRPAENIEEPLKRPCASKYVEVVRVPEGTAPLSMNAGKTRPAEFLERFISPMPVEEFLAKYWKKKAVGFVDGGSKRAGQIRKALCGMDLKELLEQSPSDHIRAWTTPLTGGPVDSVEVDEATALALERAGASLYFRAPAEFTDRLLPRLTLALGLNFAGFYPDAALRSETETFVARKGHKTSWHTDFQENFTIQLTGTRRWRMKRGVEERNIRALSPHYKTMTAYEQQMKLARYTNAASEYLPEAGFFDDCEEIVLNAGDVMYHPSGMWHEVTCESDQAISINFSLLHSSWAEVFGSGMHQALWKNVNLRDRISEVHSYEELRACMEARLAEAKAAVAALTIDDFCPPNLSLPRKTFILVKPASEEGLPEKLSVGALAAMVPLVEGAMDSDSEDEGGCQQYAVHLNFGNSDIESFLRTVVKVPDALAPVMKVLRHGKRFSLPELREIIKETEEKTLLGGLLHAMITAGYLKPEA